MWFTLLPAMLPLTLPLIAQIRGARASWQAAFAAAGLALMGVGLVAWSAQPPARTMDRPLHDSYFHLAAARYLMLLAVVPAILALLFWLKERSLGLARDGFLRAGLWGFLLGIPTPQIAQTLLLPPGMPRDYLTLGPQFHALNLIQFACAVLQFASLVLIASILILCAAQALRHGKHP